jgi:hypothetical protein
MSNFVTPNISVQSDPEIFTFPNERMCCNDMKLHATKYNKVKSAIYSGTHFHLLLMQILLNVILSRNVRNVFISSTPQLSKIIVI